MGVLLGTGMGKIRGIRRIRRVWSKLHSMAARISSSDILVGTKETRQGRKLLCQKRWRVLFFVFVWMGSEYVKRATPAVFVERVSQLF